MVQRRDHPDHTWFIGKGKAQELHELCLAVDADTVVFDNELSPAQQFNLEKLLGRTAIDRTAVILDIFAQNAHTLEGKAQVELALLRYRLPRLRRGADAKLSQQRGGVGTRFGGGETKLEVDRRRIKRAHQPPRDRARRARPHPHAAAPAARPQRPRRGDDRRLHERRQVDAAQHAHRRRRAGRGPPVRHARPDHPPPRAARRRAGAADRHRRLRAPPAPRPGRVVQVARSRWPRRADFLVHVVDASAADPEGQIDAVREVLAEIGADAGARAARVQQGRPAPAGGQAPRRRPPRLGRGQRGDRGGDRRLPAHPRRPAALDHHGRRAGRAVRPRRRAGGDPPRGRGRVDHRRGRRTCGSGPGCRTPRPVASPSSSSPTIEPTSERDRRQPRGSSPRRTPTTGSTG